MSYHDKKPRKNNDPYRQVHDEKDLEIIRKTVEEIEEKAEEVEKEKVEEVIDEVVDEVIDDTREEVEEKEEEVKEKIEIVRDVVQDRIIKNIEAEVKKVEPKVLSSKRSAFLNKERLGGGSNCLYDIVIAVDVSISVSNNLEQAHRDFISALITSWTPQMNANHIQMGVCIWSNTYGFYQTASNKWLSNDPVELDVVAQNLGNNLGTGGGTFISQGLIGGEELLNKAQTDTVNCSLGDRTGQPNYKKIMVFVTDLIVGGSGSATYMCTYWGAQAQAIWQSGIDIYGIRTDISSAPTTPAQELFWREFIQPICGTDGTPLCGDYSYTAAGTIPQIAPIATTIAGNICSSPPSSACYNIGDTGPEGGTIFAVPLGHPQNNGVNQTNFYYEVAKNDIAIGGTPNAGFNASCGTSIQTPIEIVNVGINPGISAIGFNWGPGSVQYIAGVPIPWNQSFNYQDYVGWEVSGVDDNGNQLFAPGTTITSSSYPQLLPTSTPPYLFIGSASSPSLGTLTTSASSTITLTPPSTPWSASGAEWGVHDKSNIVTSTDFGTGHKNTDAIDAYPLSPGNPTGGIHPWLDTHDIAATLCKQHPSAKDDWFLPSRDEFVEMVDASNTYSFPLNLNTLGQNSEHQYWTSSQYRHDPTLGSPPQFPDKYSWAVKSNGAPGLAYRCHALSVRPIRRFECEPDPCESNPNCDCVEYNYRERACGGLPGVACSSDLGKEEEEDPNSSHLDNIGGNRFRFECNATDVLGNSYTLSDFQDDSQGYTITVWAKDYTFIGKWKYDNFTLGSTQAGGYIGNSSSASDRYNLWFEGVTHLEGNYPVTTWSTNSGVVGESQVFFKLECAATSSFASGCSSLMWGNNTMDSYFDWPAACILINPAHPTSPMAGQHACVPWDGVFSPLDINGNTIPVEIGSNSCFYPAGTYGQACGCDYQVGDTGPGGGIIVATPWMNINSPSDGCVGPITPALQGMALKNPTDYYYEISPENLNTPTDAVVFGSADIGIPGTMLELNTAYVTPDTNVVYCSPINPPSNINNEYVGQGEQATQDIMNATGGNPTSSFPLVGNPTVQNAFEICSNYSNNGYNDWFLPTTYEMEFARNYSPPGTLHDTVPQVLGIIPIGYWTCNAPLMTGLPQAGNQSGPIDMYNVIDDNNSAYGVSGNSFNTTSGPYGYNWRTSLNRRYPLNVRAMRKFKCNNNNSPTANNKRSRFVEKNRKSEEVGPFGVAGYYPLYGTITGATKASPESSYHIHEFGGFEYYMPNGLEMGVTQFHGDWDPKKSTINIGNIDIGDGIE
jgi:hypothetical protein